jgi:PhoPQ-activated pathogenicity-related protein
LRAVHHSAASGTALPNLNWELAAQSDLRLCVQADRDASVRLWTANSDDGDFRDAVWTAGSWTRDDNPTFVLERPQQGYAAAFAEARFGGGRSAFTLSTTLAVLAPTAERDGPRSSGLMGVCKAQ